MASTDTKATDVGASKVTIECRSCNNDMPEDSNTCPHCGSRVITRMEAAALAIGGLLLTAGMAFAGIWPLAAVGLLALLAGVGFYRNRSQKIKEARTI